MSIISRGFEKLSNLVSAISESTPFKVLKTVSSAVVGVPTAMVASAAAIAGYVAATTVRAVTAHFRKVLGGKDLVFDPISTAARDFFAKSFKDIWYNWGFFVPIKTAKFIRDNWKVFQSQLGRGDASDEGHDTEENKAALAGEDAMQGMIQREVTKIDDASLATRPQQIADEEEPTTSPADPSATTLGPTHHHHHRIP